MPKFTIYQINDRDDANLPVVRDLMCFGSEAYKSEMIDMFEIVAEIESDTIEMVFHWMNRDGWRNDSERVTLRKQARSLSIGDMVFDQANPAFYMVDHEGFTKVKMDLDMKDMGERLQALHERVTKLIA
jgi:hypothetical protein